MAEIRPSPQAGYHVTSWIASNAWSRKASTEANHCSVAKNSIGSATPAVRILVGCGGEIKRAPRSSSSVTMGPVACVTGSPANLPASDVKSLYRLPGLKSVDYTPSISSPRAHARSSMHATSTGFKGNMIAQITTAGRSKRMPALNSFNSSPRNGPGLPRGHARW